MGEHVQFIDGMLDPTERTSKNCEASAKEFEKLTEECAKTRNQMIHKSLQDTEAIRDLSDKLQKDY